MVKHHPRDSDSGNSLGPFNPARRAATRLGLSDVRDHLPRRTPSELAEMLLPGRPVTFEMSDSLFEVYRNVFDPLSVFAASKSHQSVS